MAKQVNVRTLITLMILAVIVAFGCWVRIVNLQESLWLDELHTSWSVSGHMQQVAGRAADGNQAPLFYWAEWLVVRCLGQHEYSLRLISLLAGVLLIPAASWLAWRGTRSTIASVVAALLVAIDPDLIFYSVEARPYGLVSLIGLFQMALFVGLILAPASDHAAVGGRNLETEIAAPNQPASWLMRWCFAGLTVLLFYLHYTAILILVPELVIFSISQLFRPARNRYSLARLSVDLLLVAVCCLPAIPHVLDIAARKDDWSTITRVWPIDPRFLRMLAAYAIPISAISLIWILARGCFRDKSKWSFATLAKVAALTLSFLVLFAAVWLTTRFQLAALLLPRYLAVLIALPVLGAGLSVSLFRHTGLRIVLAVSLLGAAFTANYWFSPWFTTSVRIGAVLPMHADEDWRSAVAEINSHSQFKPQIIFLMSELVEDHRLAATPGSEPPNENFVEYCKFPLQGIYQVSPERFEIIPLPSAPIARRFSDDLLQQMETQGGAWIVSRGPRAANSALAELDYLIGQRGVITGIQIKSFGNVIVLKLDAE